MKILASAFLNHDSSISVINNGRVDEYCLIERKTRNKHDGHSIFKVLHQNYLMGNSVKNIDYISNSFFELSKLKFRETFFYEFQKKKGISVESNSHDHHLCHAHCGFFGSNFEDALCIVIDGNGSDLNGVLEKNKRTFETLSIYQFQKGKLTKTIYKELIQSSLIGKYVRGSLKVCSNDNHFDYNYYEKNYNQNINLKSYTLKNDEEHLLSIGILYEQVASELGFSQFECGKLMGLAQYKNHEDKLPHAYSSDEWIKKVSISNKAQSILEKRILDIVKKYVDETGIKNVVLTGGVFLNCVSNYNLIKQLPNVNFHVDPICNDNGISIGKGLMVYTEKTNRIPCKIENFYLGHKEDSNLLKEKIKISNLNYIENINYSDIVNILLKGELVSLFQGRSESGQRSLGNRSLLFDPRIKNGRTIVNAIKKREDFRPFAASILFEHAKTWFDLGSLTESPTMSFAVDAYENAIKEVAAVIHADGTCRIQTVTKKQNEHFYNLINEFYKKTGIPMILNTSFNLAGEPLVETFEDAILVMKNSELKYTYFPEISILVCKD